MLEGAEVGRVGFGGQHMVVSFEFLLIFAKGEVDSGSSGVRTPRVGASVGARGGAEPFAHGGQTTFFPLGVGEGTRVRDRENGRIAGDDNLAVVFVPLTRAGQNI